MGDPDEELRSKIALPAPEDIPDAGLWTLHVHNKKVLKGWLSLCQHTRANARNCYLWLRAHATKPHPGRCYPLKGSKYAGVWAYEVGSGDRVYYKPDEETHVAVVFYAGPHPSTVPESPA